MFSRATSNPMEESVVKATDENLTSENWELILSVCDKVDSDNENGARNAVLAIQKRLGHRNATVQLQSLSLAEALSKNCGSKVHREIASRAFTQSLVRLMNDRTIHQKVKDRTGMLIKQWADDFKHDPSLGIMTETYKSLKLQGLSLDPPSRPRKSEISEADKRREEEELQMALAMSLNETKITNGASASQNPPAAQNRRNEVDNGPNAYTLPATTVNDPYALPTFSSSTSAPYQAQQAVQQNSLEQTPIAQRTAATISRCRALYDFNASETGELTFRRGDVITVIESVYKDWWRGSLRGHTGIFPTNYVENLPDPTPADLQREAEEENRVFSEAKNVEKLLSMLSSAELDDPALAENEQLQNLYHSTISIRPKLVRLIEKYSQKKDDLISLNEKFMKARRDYDELMEASLAKYNTSHSYSQRPTYDSRSQPPANYQRPIHSGNYSHGDPRQAPQMADPRLTQYPPEFHRQGSGPQVEQVYQRMPSGQQQQLFQPQHQNSGHNLNEQYTGPRSNGASQPDYSESYHHQQPVRQPSYHDMRAQAPPAAQLQSPVGTSSVENTPTSPSQELSQAFPPQAQTYTSTYDHARAEKEGGPPISYYHSGDPDDVPNYATPVIPNLAQPSAPDVGSAPSYDSPVGSPVDPAHYYRRGS